MRYFERSNEKSLLRKFAKVKIRSNKKEVERYKSIAAVIDETSNHTAERSMSECPIPVLSRFDNIFYEINVKLKLTCKTKNTGRSLIYLLSNSLRKEMIVS